MWIAAIEIWKKSNPFTSGTNITKPLFCNDITDITERFWCLTCGIGLTPWHIIVVTDNCYCDARLIQTRCIWRIWLRQTVGVRVISNFSNPRQHNLPLQPHVLNVPELAFNFCFQWTLGCWTKNVNNYIKRVYVLPECWIGPNEWQKRQSDLYARNHLNLKNGKYVTKC